MRSGRGSGRWLVKSMMLVTSARLHRIVHNRHATLHAVSTQVCLANAHSQTHTHTQTQTPVLAGRVLSSLDRFLAPRWTIFSHLSNGSIL